MTIKTKYGVCRKCERTEDIKDIKVLVPLCSGCYTNYLELIVANRNLIEVLGNTKLTRLGNEKLREVKELIGE